MVPKTRDDNSHQSGLARLIEMAGVSGALHTPLSSLSDNALTADVGPDHPDAELVAKIKLALALGTKLDRLELRADQLRGDAYAAARRIVAAGEAPAGQGNVETLFAENGATRFEAVADRFATWYRDVCTEIARSHAKTLFGTLMKAAILNYQRAHDEPDDQFEAGTESTEEMIYRSIALDMKAIAPKPPRID